MLLCNAFKVVSESVLIKGIMDWFGCLSLMNKNNLANLVKVVRCSKQSYYQ